MPSELEHLFEAQTNEEFSRSFDVDTTTYNNWVATGIFYSALHLVEGYLAKKSNIHSTDHGRRITNVQTHIVDIYDQYRELKDISQNARYFCVEIAPEETTDCFETLEEIKEHFRSSSPVLITS